MFENQTFDWARLIYIYIFFFSLSYIGRFVEIYCQKQMHRIASIASLDSICTNSRGCKTVNEALRDSFDPLEISLWLTMPIRNRYPVTAIILLKYSGDCLIRWPVLPKHDNYRELFKSCFTREIVLNSLTPPSNTAATSNHDNPTQVGLVTCLAGTVGSMFTGLTFNNSPVNLDQII